MAVDEDAFRELTKAAVAKDYLGMADLEVRGRIFGVDQGTRVLPIDSGFAKTKVRILEGKGLGRSGWVPYEFVN